MVSGASGHSQASSIATADKLQTSKSRGTVPNRRWGFPKIRGTILGVPIIRIIVFWGLYWGLLILGNYHISISVNSEPKVNCKPQALFP